MRKEEFIVELTDLLIDAGIKPKDARSISEKIYKKYKKKLKEVL